jgi:hypothetical protein
MLTTWHPLSTRVSTNFADKRQSLGRYTSFSNSGHGMLLLLLLVVVVVVGRNSNSSGIYGSTVRWVGLGPFFSFLNLRIYTVDRTPCAEDQPNERPLCTQIITQT